MCSIFRYPLVVYLVSLISKSDLFLIFFSTHLTTKQKALRTCLQGLGIGFQLRVWRWVKECCLLGHFTIASTSPWKLPLGGFQEEKWPNLQMWFHLFESLEFKLMQGNQLLAIWSQPIRSDCDAAPTFVLLTEASPNDVWMWIMLCTRWHTQTHGGGLISRAHKQTEWFTSGI